MSAPRNLATLVGSRICHDLVSPLGAIGNGVELLGLSGLPDSPEMQLISESVRNANAKLRFFRIAFGNVGDDQHIARREVMDILGAIAAGGRMSYHWTPVADPTRTQAKLAFLSLQCLESALPAGGDIAVRADAGRWTITGEGPQINADAGVWTALTDPRARPDITANQVQFALLPEAAAMTGRTLIIDQHASRIAIRF